MHPVTAPDHVYARFEHLREIPGNVWMQAGIATVIVMGVV